MTPYKFQQTAIEKLTESFKNYGVIILTVLKPLYSNHRQAVEKPT